MCVEKRLGCRHFHERSIIILAVVLCFILIWVPSSVFAHKVYLFAWVEGNTVSTESYFSGKKKVMGGPIKVFDPSPVTENPVQLLDGRYGPYLTDGETNVSLRKGMLPEEITFDEALGMLADKAAQGPPKKKKKTAKKKAAKKKSTAKKATVKKKTTAKKKATKKKSAAKRSPKKKT